MAKNMRIEISLYFFLVMAIICGCAPSLYEYYKPIAKSGKLSSRFGLLAPNDQIEFSFDRVNVSVQGGGETIIFDITYPYENSVRFLSNEVRWYINSPKDNHTKKFYLKTYCIKSNKYVQTTPMKDFASMERDLCQDADTESGYYYSDVELFSIKKEHYFIELPPLEINKKVFQIPLIEFKKSKGFAIIPINS